MKLLIFLVLFLSAKAFDTSNGRDEEIEELKIQLLKMESRMASMETRETVKNEVLEGRMATMERNQQPSMTEYYHRCQQLEGRVQALEFQMNSDTKDLSITPGESNDNQKMNDTELEERVQILEFQMENVQGDLANVEEDFDDLGSSVSNVEGQITSIQAAQVVQDQRLLDVENEIEVVGSGIVTIEGAIDELQTVDIEVNSSLEGLDTRVTTLESQNGTDDSIIEALNELETEVELLNGTVSSVESSVLILELTDLELDSRIDDLEAVNGTDESIIEALNEFEAEVDGLTFTILDLINVVSGQELRLDNLELDGTVAFHVGFFTTRPVIPVGGIAVWDDVNVNLGDGYNSVTGEFVVPSGGAGLYYLYAHFLFDLGEYHYMDIRHNGDDVCDAFEDNRNSGDYGGSSCGAVVELAEGDIIDIFHSSGTDDTPYIGLVERSTFSGFRIAPAN